MIALDGLRLLPSVAASRLGLAPPYKLLLAVTDRCDHRCRQCGIWRRHPGPELTPDEVHRLLASQPALRWLDVTGGEPTLRPDAPALAAAVREGAPRLVFLHFATNGWDPERVGRFATALGADAGQRLVVTVSIDGDPALHDHLRGRRGAFERAVATARELAERPGVEVYLGTTVSPANLPALPRVRAALAEALPALAADRWHVNLLNRSPHFFGNEELPALTPDEVLRAATEVEHLRGLPRDPFALVERIFLRTLRRHARTGTAPVPCQALRASVFVGPTGDVYPCHVLPERLGNVRAAGGDLAAVLADAPARAVRSRLAREGCAGCWTPCEAYHAIVASPLRAIARALGPESL